MGRPQKTLKDMNFPENWKDIVFEMSINGCSETEIRAKFITYNGTNAKSITSMWHKLQERDEEFREAIQISKTLCQAWWENEGKKYLFHDKGMVFETGCWYANMKNRFGWRDKKEVETNDKTPRKVIIQVVNVNQSGNNGNNGRKPVKAESQRSI
jgi:hypothetical protein